MSTEWPTQAELYELLHHVVGVLEKLNISYMVVGGLAAIIHGAPRFTRDADIVVDMQFRHTGSQKHAQDARNVLATNWYGVSFSQLYRSGQVVRIQAELESILEDVAQELGVNPPARGK